MAEYIERSTIANLLSKIAIAPAEAAEYAAKVYAAVNSAPAADVVPVVRCRDCVHCGFDDSLWWRHCTRLTGWVSVKADDYCSYGERMDNDG